MMGVSTRRPDTGFDICWLYGLHLSEHLSSDLAPATALHPPWVLLGTLFLPPSLPSLSKHDCTRATNLGLESSSKYYAW